MYSCTLLPSRGARARASLPVLCKTLHPGKTVHSSEHFCKVEAFSRIWARFLLCGAAHRGRSCLYRMLRVHAKNRGSLSLISHKREHCSEPTHHSAARRNGAYFVAVAAHSCMQ